MSWEKKMIDLDIAVEQGGRREERGDPHNHLLGVRVTLSPGNHIALNAN